MIMIGGQKVMSIDVSRSYGRTRTNTWSMKERIEKVEVVEPTKGSSHGRRHLENMWRCEVN